MSTSDLPLLNACLNALSFFLLLGGLISIRASLPERHRKFMVAALIVSVLFLISYLTYHSLHGSTRFTGEGGIRQLYFAILLSHTVLAASLVVLVPVTVRHALRADFEKHRRWARVTLPIWMYVSVTGVLVYLMLYVWFAAPQVGPA